MVYLSPEYFVHRMHIWLQYYFNEDVTLREMSLHVLGLLLTEPFRVDRIKLLHDMLPAKAQHDFLQLMEEIKRADFKFRFFRVGLGPIGPPSDEIPEHLSFIYAHVAR